ncbi:unnamed protein product, partial [Closterium sp. Yama58-4]
ARDVKCEAPSLHAPPWRRSPPPPPPTSLLACWVAPVLPRPWRAPTPRPLMPPQRAVAGGAGRAGSGTSRASTLRSTRRRAPMALTCAGRPTCAAPTAPSCRTSACACA